MMVKIYQQSPTTLHALESPEYPQDKRDYLGMSLVGHPCSRYIWFSFRWAFTEMFSARIIRLFNRGHREEEVMVAELEKIGIKCHSFQQEFISCWGHMKGHCDGMADGVIEAPKTRHLLEFKTMSDKYFKEVCKLGVEQSKPIYYGQCQIGMKHYNLKRCLFMAVNKNDDSYYVERIKYDKDYADELEDKAKGIILSEVPIQAPFKPTWYLCKFCPAQYICHYKEDMEISCRTCKNVSLGKQGKWFCNDEIELDHDAQVEACDAYQQINIR